MVTLSTTYFQYWHPKGRWCEDCPMFDKRKSPFSLVYWSIMWYNVVTCLDWKIYQSLQKTITNGHTGPAWLLVRLTHHWPPIGGAMAGCETTATLMDTKHHRKNVSWVLFSFQITSNQTTSPHFVTFTESSWASENLQLWSRRERSLLSHPNKLNIISPI